MSNRKPPSSASTAPGLPRPSTPAPGNPADDTQTQQLPRIRDDKGSQPAPTAPAKPDGKGPAPKAPESRSAVPTAGSIAAGAEQTTTSRDVPAETTPKKASDAKASTPTAPKAKETPAPAKTSRKARLRLVRFDPWSVMKTAFALSIALAIVTVVAVTIVWAVLDVAGVWAAINSSVATILSDNADAFDVTDYVGFGRIMGFTILIAAIDVILITAIATVAAFLYNLAASLLGGLEITLAEEN